MIPYVPSYSRRHTPQAEKEWNEDVDKLFKPIFAYLKKKKRRKRRK